MTGFAVSTPTRGLKKYSPWRTVRDELPEWRIYFTPELPWGAHGITRWEDRTIWLQSGLQQVERRCVLEHEIQHIRRGAHSCDDHDEAVVEQATARALISLDDLLDATRWSRHPREVADAVWVTLDILTCRVRNLHPAESSALAEVLTHHAA